MNEQRLKAELSLIQELLTCPEGEEWILLKRNENLVDEELVQLMEQIATQLFREGDRQAARYLHNWAAQLHHILLKDVRSSGSKPDLSQAYLKLIQALLDCPEGSENQILSQYSDLLGPGLVDAMHQVAQKMSDQGMYDGAQYLEKLARQMNQSWIRDHLVPQRSLQPKAPQPDKSEPEAATKTASSPLPLKKSQELEKKELKSENQSFIPDPWDSETPVSSALQLKVPQQIANGLHDVSLLLHQIDKAIHAQTQALHVLAEQAKQLSTSHSNSSSLHSNPIWYMDVLERACERDWVLTTEEIEQLIGVKPKCHADETFYQRGCWMFEKAGKLGAQTAWRVQKV